MRRVFVCFLEEIERPKKAFRNYLTFTFHAYWHYLCLSSVTSKCICNSFAHAYKLQTEGLNPKKRFIKAKIIN